MLSGASADKRETGYYWVLIAGSNSEPEWRVAFYEADTLLWYVAQPEASVCIEADLTEVDDRRIVRKPRQPMVMGSD